MRHRNITWAEAVRNRAELYLGSRDRSGALALIAAVVDALASSRCANRAIRVVISSMADGVIEIRDDGRGLPTTPLEFRGVTTSALERALTRLAGTASTAELERAGPLVECGALLNAFTSNLEIRTVWEGRGYCVRSSRGDIVEPVRRTEVDFENGTHIVFELDHEVFGRFTTGRELLEEVVDALDLDANDAAVEVSSATRT